MVVVLTNSICIYDMIEMNLAKRITDIPPNPKGTIAFSAYLDKCILAFPNSDTSGSVALYDINAIKVLTLLIELNLFYFIVWLTIFQQLCSWLQQFLRMRGSWQHWRLTIERLYSQPPQKRVLSFVYFLVQMVKSWWSFVEVLFSKEGVLSICSST